MTEERSQAIALDYVIGLGIALVLTMGLLVASGGFMADQREAAARTQLEVVGQQVAADIEATDRLVGAAGADGTVYIQRQLPEVVAGSQYRIRLVETDDPYLRLRSVQPNTTATVRFTNVTAVAASDVGGGPILIDYTGDALVIEPGGS
jgi:hypothetical protein